MTDPKKITLTLTRWHLAADRLNAKAKELEAQVLAAFNSTQIAALQGDHHLEQLRHQKEKTAADLTKIRLILNTIGVIRSSLADANAKAGVTQELSKLEALNREIRLLNTLSQINLDSKIEIEYLTQYFENQSKNGAVEGRSLYRVNSGAEVAMMTKAEQDQSRQEKEALQSKAYALSDTINALNKESLSVSIDSECARLAGIL